MTRAPEGIAETAAWMRNVRRNLQRRGFPLEWAWVVECNERRDGRHAHHVHALAHGSIPPEHVLSDVAQRAGFGAVAEVRRVGHAPGAARYLWAAREKWRTIDLPHRLWTNGGHLQHSSRYFWRVDGEHVAGGWKAVSRVLREQPAD
ncbi:hypothetical protein [Aeromicrobium fastidiosum]|uniref:Replication protein n=1 Tax=Aeromicrobium fastidiosum TaxID=52699 RepID=A0A641AL79_9ACTN|nr:hypothetical protein [Aeromicrobium fastidiosum]KAA1376123.1 hypothetical protein ESP62_011810 [Aeromicrobium fastidiosum]MBP2391997.1 hypothetical protein [Aeromicrobium fastidiosum]